LDAVLVLERALVVAIRQAPAWLDAKERPAIVPKRKIRHFAEIESDAAAARWIAKHCLKHCASTMKSWTLGSKAAVGKN